MSEPILSTATLAQRLYHLRQEATRLETLLTNQVAAAAQTLSGAFISLPAGNPLQVASQRVAQRIQSTFYDDTNENDVL